MVVRRGYRLFGSCPCIYSSSTVIAVSRSARVRSRRQICLISVLKTVLGRQNHLCATLHGLVSLIQLRLVVGGSSMADSVGLGLSQR